MRLQDFVESVNCKLIHCRSENRVTAAHVLALRLYTASTFRRLNTALRDRGTGKSQRLGFRACAQSARKCLLKMQAIVRPPAKTFRGITGYLGEKFESSDMGMDYAFFSATTTEAVAEDFTASEPLSVLFEIQYLRGCPGVDVSMLSVHPGEKEVLFPPCTGLSLMEGNSGTPRTGEGAGHARVSVTPQAAVEN